MSHQHYIIVVLELCSKKILKFNNIKNENRKVKTIHFYKCLMIPLDGHLIATPLGRGEAIIRKTNQRSIPTFFDIQTKKLYLTCQFNN